MREEWLWQSVENSHGGDIGVIEIEHRQPQAGDLVLMRETLFASGALIGTDAVIEYHPGLGDRIGGVVVGGVIPGEGEPIATVPLLEGAWAALERRIRRMPDAQKEVA